MATTFTISAGSKIKPYRNVRKRNFPEAASQTFVRGDVLILQTSADKGNQVKISGADPTTDRFLVGVAAEDASGVENTSLSVWLFAPDAEFSIYGNGTLDVDDISVRYGIVRDATNKVWQLDLTETSAIVFKILELLDAAGDVNGRYIVQPVQSESLYGAN
jgi:hypothetical protein